MTAFIKTTLLVLTMGVLSLGTVHKFYVSVTNVRYSEKDTAFQITTRIFIDDLEAVLLERYGVQCNLATSNESKIAEDYIKKYFNTKLVIELDGEKKDYNFLGYTYDNDVILCYLEIPEIKLSAIKSIAIQNEILTDMFEEQQNIVHFKWKGKKKSFVLIRENNKGMLNL